MPSGNLRQLFPHNISASPPPLPRRDPFGTPDSLSHGFFNIFTRNLMTFTFPVARSGKLNIWYMLDSSYTIPNCNQISNVRYRLPVSGPATAEQTGESQSALIRQAIDRYLVRFPGEARNGVLRQAKGLWKDRTELTDIRALRGEFDRSTPRSPESE